MVLGLLPAIRGGLGELAKTGQHARLIDGYLTPYARAFETVRYFSYLAESLDAYTADPEVLARVSLHPGGGWHPWAYGFVMPLRYAREFRRCAIFRVFQITGALPAVIAKRRFGVPFVTTYGFWYGRLGRSRATGVLRRTVETLGLRAADGVIVTTPELGAHVAPRVGAAKVHLIPNGVDTARFVPVPQRPRRPKNVLYVGRLSDEKNLGEIVEAAARLAGRVELRLTFVGNGPARASLETAARRGGVAAEVVPVVEHRRVPAYPAHADAFVLPSQTQGHPSAPAPRGRVMLPRGLSSRRILLDAELERLTSGLGGVVLEIGAKPVARGRWRPRRDRVRRWVRLNLEPGERPHVVGDAQVLPLRDASVDWVVCVEVLQYVVSPEAAMREIARVLRPGGTAVLAVPFFHRSEEHTSELQSPCNLVCRLLLEKKKKKT